MSVHDSSIFVALATEALRAALDQNLGRVNLGHPFAQSELVIGDNGVPAGAIDLASIPEDLKARLNGRVPYVILLP